MATVYLAHDLHERPVALKGPARFGRILEPVGLAQAAGEGAAG